MRIILLHRFSGYKHGHEQRQQQNAHAAHKQALVVELQQQARSDQGADGNGHRLADAEVTHAFTPALLGNVLGGNGCEVCCRESEAKAMNDPEQQNHADA